MNSLTLLACVTLLITCAECAKILVIFQAASQSHTILGKKLVDGLLKRGHHITMVTPFSQKPQENFTLIQLETLLEWKKESDKNLVSSSIIQTVQAFLEMTRNGVEHTFNHPEIQKIIREKTKFDLVLMSQFFNEAFLGLAHHVEAPYILVGTSGSNPVTNTLMANPNPIYIRGSLVGSSRPDFFGRLSRLLGHIGFTIFLDLFSTPTQNELMRKNIPNAPPLEELKRNVSLVLLNSHISIESPRPNLPNVINIGGFHLSEPKELPEDIKTFLDDAKDGAILFSFGSNVLIDSLEKDKVAAMIKVLGELAPIRVVFKSEIEIENARSNIMIRKWLPQADILAHPNVKVFVSHMGLGGLTEGVYNGVPLLGVPFFADQHMNAEEADRKGFAIHLKMADLTEETFRKSLKELLQNPSYREEIRRRSGLMKSQPVKPIDNAMFWIEHIIEYGGGSHLQNEGVSMPWYQLYLVDIYVFFTLVLCLLTFTSYYATKYSFRLVKWLFYKKKSCCDGKNKVKKS